MHQGRSQRAHAKLVVHAEGTPGDDPSQVRNQFEYRHWCTGSICTCTPSMCNTQRSSTRARAFRPERARVSEGEPWLRSCVRLVGQVQQKVVALALGPISSSVVGREHLHLRGGLQHTALAQQAPYFTEACGFVQQVEGIAVTPPASGLLAG